jgi:hypothetical protein
MNDEEAIQKIIGTYSEGARHIDLTHFLSTFTPTGVVRLLILPNSHHPAVSSQ